MTVNEQIFADAREDLLYVLPGHRARLEHFMDAVFAGKLNSILHLHFALHLIIGLRLVANEVHLYVLRGVHADLLQPVGQVDERLRPRYVVYHYHAVGTSVENSGH